jgi:uncharacterized protein YrrD
MARNDKDFLGLEVVSLEDASVVGEVDGLVVDESKRAVVAMVVDLGLYEAKLLPFGEIRGMGEDAVTIDSAKVLRLVSKSGDLEEIANRDVMVSDSLVLTDAGDAVGTVGDYFVDPATGSIQGLEIIVEGEEEDEAVLIPTGEIIGIGEELVLVKTGFKDKAVPTGEAL